MCASAPNDFEGLHLDRPTSCANWVSGMTVVVLSLLTVLDRDSTVSLEYGRSRIRTADVSIRLGLTRCGGRHTLRRAPLKLEDN